MTDENHLLKGDWPDVMIDLETTGHRPDRNAILQIAAVRFDLLLGAIDADDMFNMCLKVPPHRFWQEVTRAWHLETEEKINHLQYMVDHAQDPREVIAKFIDWIGVSKPRLWAKPTHFDAPFLDSYVLDYGFDTPWKYWEVSNVRTWIEARYFPNKMRITQKEIQNDGAHNALHDCIHQIDWLFQVYEDTKNGGEKLAVQN